MALRKMAASITPSRWSGSARPPAAALRSRRLSSGRTSHHHSATKVATPRTLSAKPPAEKRATASALTSASSSQPTTSLMAAALMAITPSGRRVRSNSIMMRPRIGSAVIENAVATNRAVASRSPCPTSTGAPTQPTAAPSTKGAASPAPATHQTARRCRRSVRCAKSNSSPIWNISRISPSCDSTCIGSPGTERNT